MNLTTKFAVVNEEDPTKISRHRVYVLFWTWAIGPFVCTHDIVSAAGTKSLGATQRCRITLYPRKVPTGFFAGNIVREDKGYLDVLRPNDWAFVFVDPFDTDAPEPLFVGLIDDVRFSINADNTGIEDVSIVVSCSGWEKALQITSCISDAFVSKTINLANLYDIALTAAGDDKYIGTIPNLIAGIVKAFLNAGSGEAFAQNLATPSVSREDLAVQKMRNLVSQALNPLAALTSGATPENTASRQNPIEAILGQFELPGTETPLWQAIKLAFEDLGQRTFAVPEAMVHMLGMPLSRFVDEWSNPIINVLIYDVRRISRDGLAHLSRANRYLKESELGGYTAKAFSSLVEEASGLSAASGTLSGLVSDVAPYMILMQRPTFCDEIRDLEGPSISSSQLSAIDLGFSDSDHYNMAWLESSSLNRVPYRAVANLSGFDANRYRALEMIRRHGLRIYNDSTNAWPDTTRSPAVATVPTHSEETFKEWNTRIQKAGLDQVELLTGSVSIPRFQRGLFLGGKLEIVLEAKPGVFFAGDHRVFYVESIDYNYTANNGYFSTSVGLTRGYSFNSPNVF